MYRWSNLYRDYKLNAMIIRESMTWAEAARLKRKAEQAARSEVERATEQALDEPCVHRGAYVGIEPGTNCDPPAFVFRCNILANNKPCCAIRLSTCVIVNGVLMRRHSICHDCEFQDG